MCSCGYKHALCRKDGEKATSRRKELLAKWPKAKDHADMRLTCGSPVVRGVSTHLQLLFAARGPPKTSSEPRRGRGIVCRNSRISLSAGRRACKPAAKPTVPGVILVHYGFLWPERTPKRIADNGHIMDGDGGNGIDIGIMHSHESPAMGWNGLKRAVPPTAKMANGQWAGMGWALALASFIYFPPAVIARTRTHVRPLQHQHAQSYCAHVQADRWSAGPLGSRFAWAATSELTCMPREGPTRHQRQSTSKVRSAAIPPPPRPCPCRLSPDCLG
jgi:hypothetical protein